ncbi:MAG: O-antigen ligase family protein, partial [Chloroflexota bacterium]
MLTKVNSLPQKHFPAVPEEAWLLPLVVLAGALIGLLPTAGVAVVVLGGIAVFLILVKQEYGVYLLVFAVPFGSLREVQIGPLSASGTEFLIGVTAISWAARLAARRDLKISFTSLSWPLAMFIGILLASAAAALSLALSLKEVSKWLELLLVFLLVVNLVDRRRQVTVIFVCLALASFLQAIMGWYQFLSRSGPPSFLIGEHFLRAYGTFGQPNPYAGYLVFSVSMLCGLLITAVAYRRVGKSLLSFGIFMGTAIVVLLAVLMSFSRGAWLALFVALCVIAVIASRRALGYLSLLFFVGVLLLTLGAFQLVPAAAVERLSVVTESFSLFDARGVAPTDENWAIVERMANWQSSWEMFLDNPIMGVGIGNFSLFYPDYALPGWDVPTLHAHNFYLNLLAEGGVLGLIGYTIFMVSVFVFVCRTLAGRRANEENAALVSRKGVAIGVIGAMVALSVHNLFDNLYVHSMNAQVG